jgi:hypothetical protein
MVKKKMFKLENEEKYKEVNLICINQLMLFFIYGLFGDAENLAFVALKCRLTFESLPVT